MTATDLERVTEDARTLARTLFSTLLVYRKGIPDDWDQRELVDHYLSEETRRPESLTKFQDLQQALGPYISISGGWDVEQICRAVFFAADFCVTDEAVRGMRLLAAVLEQYADMCEDDDDGIDQ